ncbi:MAG: biotin--[acetyl-CoA-carboxylase] ligase [Candidatus Limivicinus sp.]|jgi:BirA family biotin operon repressor/biotin-[acetyl-CoA-carboxylase] ligase
MMDFSNFKRKAPVIYRESISSTNTVLKEMAEENPPEGLVLTAGRQTGGRGRLGRSFESPESGIYMSMLLYPRCSPEQAALITPCAAVAVARAVKRICGREPDIKWPNDLQIEGKKICGILTEASFAVDRFFVVVGIGLNVNTPPAALSPELRDSASSLRIVLGREIPLQPMAEAMIEELDGMYARWTLDPGCCLEDYRRLCISTGRDVRLIRGGVSRDARSLGIADDYSLIVEADGKREHVHFGEVSIRNK